MYRKYFNSSYYIAKTQENSPDRLEHATQMPLEDQTNLNGTKNSQKKQQAQLQQLVNFQLRSQQTQNINNSLNTSAVPGSSHKRVKTLSTTPEKYGLQRPASFSRNGFVRDTKSALYQDHQPGQQQQTQPIPPSPALPLQYLPRSRGNFSNNIWGVSLGSGQQKKDKAATPNSETTSVYHPVNRSHSHHNAFSQNPKILGNSERPRTNDKSYLKDKSNTLEKFIAQGQENKTHYVQNFNEVMNRIEEKKPNLDKDTKNYSSLNGIKQKVTLEHVNLTEQSDDIGVVKSKQEQDQQILFKTEQPYSLDRKPARRLGLPFTKKRSGSSNIFQEKMKADSDNYTQQKPLNQIKTIQHEHEEENSDQTNDKILLIKQDERDSRGPSRENKAPNQEKLKKITQNYIKQEVYQDGQFLQRKVRSIPQVLGNKEIGMNRPYLPGKNSIQSILNKEGSTGKSAFISRKDILSIEEKSDFSENLHKDSKLQSLKQQQLANNNHLFNNEQEAHAKNGDDIVDSNNNSLLPPSRCQSRNNSQGNVMPKIQAKPTKLQQLQDLKKQVNENETKIDIMSRTRKGVVGGVPKKNNQDNYFISEKMSNEQYQQIYLLGVMDGHGMNGHFVSQFVKSHFLNEFLMQDSSKNYCDRLSAINEIISDKLSKSTIDCSFSGTTSIALLLLFKENTLRIISCNCGDSRAIMGLLKAAHPDSNHTFLNNSENDTSQDEGKSNKKNSKTHSPIQKQRQFNSFLFEVLELSRDHKPELPDERERILKHNGRIDSYRDEYGNQLGPMRVWKKEENIPGIAMSRSLGDDVATSLGVTWQSEIKEFHIQFTTLRDGQSLPDNQEEQGNILADSGFIIIASDGVWEFLSNEDVVKEVGRFYVLDDINGACDWLLREAYHQWTCEDNSVVDDITFTLLFISPTGIISKISKNNNSNNNLNKNSNKLNTEQ